MTYFPDLSRYSYLLDQPPMLNVGWLGWEHELSRGSVPPALVDSLVQAAQNQHIIMRGVHDCELCDAESPVRFPAPVPRGYVSLGMGELHFTAQNDITYSAPSLVIHYITQHEYQPPVEFIDAVLHGCQCLLDH